MKMKKQYIILALGAMLMASCADEFDRNFMVGRPGNSAEYAYLNDYKALKEYVSDPNFHLGIGTDAADYAKQGATYVITNVNFNETVAGNAMKMASCVDKDGNMNFATVESYVNEAAKAGMNVYGHTLAWHAQQPVEWLNTLMADKPLPVTPGVENSCLVFHNGTAGANQWDKQAIYTLSTPMVQGKTYIVKISVKTDDDYAENVFGLWPIWSTSPNKNQWGGSNDVQYLASYGTSKDFKNLEWEFAAAFDHDQLQFVFGKVGGDVYLDNVSCKEKGSDAEMIANGTFDSNSLDGWSANWGGPSFEIGSVTTGGGTPGVLTEVKEKRRCIRVASDDMADAAWDTQFWLYFPDNVIHAGDSYSFSADIMANKAATAGSQTHKEPGGYIHWSGVGTLPFTENWTTFTSSGTFANESDGGYSIAFNLNDFAEANLYYLDNISLKINGTEVIKNGNCEGTDVSSFYTKEKRGSTVNSTIVDETVVYRMQSGPATYEVDVPRTCIQVIADDMVDAAWDTQFWLVFEDHPIHTGDKYEVSMNVRADKKASAGTQTHKSPGGYIHWAAIGTIPFEEEWKTYTQSGTFDNAAQEGGYSIAFNLNDFAEANTYYFDDISLKINGVEVIKNGDCNDLNGTASFVAKEKRGATVPARIVDHYTQIMETSSGGIPQTAEEKKDTLTYALDKWISGMMEACKDPDTGEMLVKAWDVVNEAISGGNPDGDLNGDGAYALQHATPDNEKDFFWQDYLGDLDYVRTVVRLARQYGGNDLKLFVNDYNLESDWDQNGKLKSLINWIKRWEADGVTKIDGIGSQMHISFYEDPATQESKKKAITESFKLMAASGKLVRISELDMGYVKKGATEGTKTADMTEEMHHQMADFYTWIIKEYLTVIPQAQQWGICQWCATDAPAASGWRGGEPVGLWDEQFYRKHTYAGFAKGFGAE